MTIAAFCCSLLCIQGAAAPEDFETYQQPEPSEAGEDDFTLPRATCGPLLKLCCSEHMAEVKELLQSLSDDQYSRFSEQGDSWVEGGDRPLKMSARFDAFTPAGMISCTALTLSVAANDSAFLADLSQKTSTYQLLALWRGGFGPLYWQQHLACLAPVGQDVYHEVTELMSVSACCYV
jgi:hypothetical protein